MTKKERVTKRMRAVGAAWATSADRYVSPDDPPGSGRMYHIHPNAEEPSQGWIMRFRNLDQIIGWIQMREAQEAIMADLPNEPQIETKADEDAWQKWYDMEYRPRREKVIAVFDDWEH